MPSHGTRANPHGLDRSLTPSRLASMPAPAWTRERVVPPDLQNLLRDLIAGTPAGAQGYLDDPMEASGIEALAQLLSQLKGPSPSPVVNATGPLLQGASALGSALYNDPSATTGALGDAAKGVAKDVRQGIRERGAFGLFGVEDVIPFGKTAKVTGGVLGAMAPFLQKMKNMGKADPNLLKLAKRREAARAGDRISQRFPDADPDWAMNGTESLDPPTKALGGIDLNAMPEDEARQFAMRMNHLKRDKTGQYIGGPAGVDSPKKLKKIRQEFDELVEAGEPGSDWYDRTRDDLRAVAGNPRRLRELIDQSSIYSMQADPPVNLGHALESQAQLAAKGSTDRIRLGLQQEKVNRMAATGQRLEQGPKTQPYAQRIADEPGVVNDFRHAANFGYVETDGTPWSSGLSLSQHAWLTAETHLAVVRANAKKLGGKTDWDTGSVQASPWVYVKGVELNAKNPNLYPTIEDGVREANKTYGDLFQKQTVYGTDEIIPGVGTEHLEGTAGMSLESRRGYVKSMPSFTDERGRDLFFDAAEVPTQPTVPTTGAFMGEGGLEINPATSSRPLLGLEAGPPSGVSPTSSAIMDAVGAIKGYLHTQKAVAWQKPFVLLTREQKAARRSSGLPNVAEAKRRGDALDFRAIMQRAATPEEMGNIEKALGPLNEKYGAGMFSSDTGDGISIFGNIELSPRVMADVRKRAAKTKQKVEDVVTKEKIKVHDSIESELRPILNEIVPDAEDVLPAQIAGNYFDTGMAGPEGTGEATRILMEKVTADEIPLLLEKIDNSPAIREEIGKFIAAQLDWAKLNDKTLRQDIMRARMIWERDRLRGLFDALQRGAVLPTVAVPIIGGSMLMSQGES